MNRAILLLAALSVLSVVGVSAATQTKKSASEKAAYNQELEKLKREKPTEYEETRIVFTFAAELLLAKLGYSVGPLDGVLDEKTQAALRLYQKNRKIPVTDDPMSFETVEQIRSNQGQVLQSYLCLPIERFLSVLSLYSLNRLTRLSFTQQSGSGLAIVPLSSDRTIPFRTLPLFSQQVDQIVLHCARSTSAFSSCVTLLRVAWLVPHCAHRPSTALDIKI